MDSNLKNICVYDAKMEGEEFVGIRIDGESPKVYFPLGYKRAETEQEQRKDILNLISVLSAYGNFSYLAQTKHDDNDCLFPIHAYIGVYTYFLNYGYYTESEAISNLGHQGKIDWNKTIKCVRPHISNRFPVYLDFVINKRQIKENTLVAQIHKYCTYESYQKIGCIFSSVKPEKPSIKFNEKLFTAIIQKKIANSFNERHLTLFRQMLDIIHSLGRSNKQRKMVYGTKDFEYVWENLIDNVFGISSNEKNKYFPNVTWFLNDGSSDQVYLEKEKHPLRPDTIMLYDGPNRDKPSIFILDAKYYRYGVKQKSCYLPGSASANKQFTYAEYVETLDAAKGKTIYNVFIMPYNASDFSDSDTNMRKIGFAKGNWKTSGKSYEKIHGVLLDVKSIMYQHSRLSTKDMEKLAELIENS